MGASDISEKTKITLGAAAGVLVILIPLVAWAVRLEMKTGSAVPKEQYIQDMADVKSDLKAIKKHLKID